MNYICAKSLYGNTFIAFYIQDITTIAHTHVACCIKIIFRMQVMHNSITLHSGCNVGDFFQDSRNAKKTNK